VGFDLVLMKQPIFWHQNVLHGVPRMGRPKHTEDTARPFRHSAVEDTARPFRLAHVRVPDFLVYFFIYYVPFLFFSTLNNLEL
jgi:hypothetical protein